MDLIQAFFGEYFNKILQQMSIVLKQHQLLRFQVHEGILRQFFRSVISIQCASPDDGEVRCGVLVLLRRIPFYSELNFFLETDILNVGEFRNPFHNRHSGFFKVFQHFSGNFKGVIH